MTILMKELLQPYYFSIFVQIITTGNIGGLHTMFSYYACVLQVAAFTRALCTTKDSPGTMAVNMSALVWRKTLVSTSVPLSKSLSLFLTLTFVKDKGIKELTRIMYMYQLNYNFFLKQYCLKNNELWESLYSLKIKSAFLMDLILLPMTGAPTIHHYQVTVASPLSLASAAQPSPVTVQTLVNTTLPRNCIQLLRPLLPPPTVPSSTPDTTPLCPAAK